RVGDILLVLNAVAGRPKILTLNAGTGRPITLFGVSLADYCVSAVRPGGLAVVGSGGLRRTIDTSSGFLQRADNRYSGLCPTVTKDRLYTLHAGALHADPSLSEEGWEINVPEPTNGRTNWTATDDTLFVVGEKTSAPDLRAYSSDGERLWVTPVPFTHGFPGLPSGLLVAGETVLIAAENGIHAFDTATGRPRWQAHTVVSEFTPALAGSVVVATSGLPSSETMLHGVDLDSGWVRWRVTLDRETFVSAVDAQGIYAIAANSPWHRAKEEHLTALDPATGRERWRLRHGLQNLAAANGRLYATAGNRFIILNPATGQSAIAQNVSRARPCGLCRP
ncbi:PQQ-binding-like beta-propeller repeat protein, partial [Actinomadura adrarensis]